MTTPASPRRRAPGMTPDRRRAMIVQAALPFGDDPRTPDNGGTDHPLCPRGLFFCDAASDVYESMSPA
ncbi:hypothetical protein OG559_27780 [Micromonospora sp. NBC_01405]|uniref:hypothetical protein n=1 Tax=Micromonospora sp. NBC_01405 TaxID=2903589 RepID=UPI003250A4F2